ncbi:hypothetical protein [Nonomuraea polychroma]|nr:hypothetical protein [Nonomuraea polychroma]
MRLTRRDGPRLNVQDLDLANRRAPIRDRRAQSAAGMNEDREEDEQREAD